MLLNELIFEASDLEQCSGIQELFDTCGLYWLDICYIITANSV